MLMTDPRVAIDRVWSIRDAILAWLYLKAMVDGNRHPVLKPQDIAATVNWQGEPLTEPEVAAASDWLYDEGYLTGTSSMGHGVVRPTITARGEMMADRKICVRPGGDAPADPQGVTTIHISNSTNVAIGSPDATQTYTVSEQIERSIALADLLAQASEGRQAMSSALSRSLPTSRPKSLRQRQTWARSRNWLYPLWESE
jgi:hypothetical protein